MNNVIATLFLALHLMLPIAVQAAEVLKSPLSYSLREYGVILCIALLGGFSRWYMAVRRGEANMLSFSALIGELAVSAFSGLLTFWICESFDVSPLITAAAAGLAGHAGGNGITYLERFGKRYAEKRFGVTGPAPLDDR
jgi:hypothetical protein